MKINIAKLPYFEERFFTNQGIMPKLNDLLKVFDNVYLLRTQDVLHVCLLVLLEYAFWGLEGKNNLNPTFFKLINDFDA